MAFNTNDLNMPTALDQSLAKYLTTFLHNPPQFEQTDRMFSTLMSKPSFMLGPGGSFIDPSQQRQAAGNAYLGERGNIASQNLKEKEAAAGELTNLGRGVAGFQNMIPFLNAANLGGGGFNMFSQLFG